MNTKLTTLLPSSLAFILAVSTAQAFTYIESINDELSNLLTSPTSLTLELGDNTLT